MKKEMKDLEEKKKEIKEKSKGFIEEFRTFIARGNVMDLAVGVIIGAAFQNIVTSLTTSFINPLIQVLTGGNGENGVAIGGIFTIKGVEFNYGAFISAVINFLIMAIILFMLVKIVNRLMTIGKKKQEEVAAVTKTDEAILLEEIKNILVEKKK